MQQAIQEEVCYKMNCTKIVASGLAALTRQNQSIALATVTNALENDVAIRGSLYAMAEFQRMVEGASQAIAHCAVPDEVLQSQLAESILADRKNEQAESDEDDQDAERKPFVKNSKAGTWHKACISGDVILQEGPDKKAYLRMREFWHKDPKCPFNVMSHGNPHGVSVENKEIHEDALNERNSDTLKLEGEVHLNAADLEQLIRTAPGYKEGQHIHLFGCGCGGHQEGIAQQLADAMKVPVSAFTKTSWSFAIPYVCGTFGCVEFENLLPEWGKIKTFYSTRSTTTKTSRAS